MLVQNIENIDNYKRDTSLSLNIDGCIVSFTSNTKNSDEAIQAAKEILLSAYRTRTTRC